jgi:hypothetical protein
MVTSPNKVLASDINTLIGNINTEENLRTTGGSGYTDLTTVSVGNNVNMQSFIDTIDRNIEINAVHCYCQGQGSIETHNGGVPLSLTALKSDFGTCGCNLNCDCETYIICSFYCDCDTNGGCGVDLCGCDSFCGCDEVCTCEVQAGTKVIDDGGINKIVSDITSLVAQCDCNSYACTCETYQYNTGTPTCTNNTYAQVCPEYSDCCPNNKRCTNNAVCINQSVCTNNTVCSCDYDCSCDEVCSCEYGG